MKNQKGFSLIELLIVVVIIGIIAAIAIPNLLASRRSANEGSSVSAMRTLHGAEITYSATAGAGSYGDMTQLQANNLVDSVIGSATAAATAKNGYYFQLFGLPASAGVPSWFDANATPVSVTGLTATGNRSFYIGEQGVIYAAPGNPGYPTPGPSRIVGAPFLPLNQ